MGLFSSKKTIHVASSVYNMAGDEADRTNYLKSTLFSAIMAPTDQYLGEVIVGNHLNGPGIRQRSFFNWSTRNEYSGLPALSVKQASAVDPDVVKPFIPVPSDPAGLVTEIQTSTLSDGDFTYFADQYILQNHPDLVDTEYAAEHDIDTNEILIQFEGGATETFVATGYDVDSQYIVANFYQTLPAEVQPLETGTLVEDETSEPDNTGYVQDSQVNTTIVTHSLSYQKTVTKTYSDSTPQDGPTTTTVNEDVDWNGLETVYSKTEFYGNDDGDVQTSDIETFLHVFERRQVVDRVSTTTETNDLGGGVTETVVTTIDGDHLDPIYDYRVDTQETINGKVVGGDQMWIYEIGSGTTALDDLAVDVSVDDTAEFYPSIPIRIWNTSITDEKYDDDTGNGLYSEAKKAYKRASSGNSFDDLIDQVEDNEDLGDIDYCYMTFAVSLNTGEEVGLKYLYDFFKFMIPYQNTTGSYMDSFIADVGSYDADKAAYDEWKDAQKNSQNTNPLHGTPAPAVPSLASPKSTTLALKADDERYTGFDTRMSWVSIDEEFFTGQGKVDAEEGDIWFEKDGSFDWTEPASLGTFATNNSIEKTLMFWQTSPTTYKRLTIYGLLHQNYIYKGKSVDITAHEALDDEDTSGFLVPLHSPTLRAMSLVDSTQLALSNSFLVFNSYEVVKKKWYQTFLGMLLIIVVVIVVSVLVSPAAMAGASGLLGANAAVGISLGLSGTAAIIAGAVANALAGIIVANIVSEVSNKLFGDKLGSVIAGIINFAISFGAAGGFNNFSLTTALTPQNLLAFSSALANGYQGYVQADIAEMNAQLAEMAEDNAEQMEDIQDMIRDLGGSNDLSFDPMQLTDVNAGNGSGAGSYIPESLDEFIHRTTMTGTDIVDITLSMVDNYTDLNLQLPS